MAPKRSIRYALAIAKWTAAGCPTRDEDEVLRILSEHCEPCKHYCAGKCNQCGCDVNSRPDGLRNKIAMATERCPAKLW